jgi:hypothetical protein
LSTRHRFKFDTKIQKKFKKSLKKTVDFSSNRTNTTAMCACLICSDPHSHSHSPRCWRGAADPRRAAAVDAVVAVDAVDDAAVEARLSLSSRGKLQSPFSA